jgi:hypothetical protein
MHRYDFLKLECKLTPWWVYDNYTSPAALFNNARGDSVLSNNCAVIKAPPDAWSVWIQATKNIPKGKGMVR